MKSLGHLKSIIQGANGNNGQNKNCHGKNAKHLMIKVLCTDFTDIILDCSLFIPVKEVMMMTIVPFNLLQVPVIIDNLLDISTQTFFIHPVNCSYSVLFMARE